PEPRLLLKEPNPPNDLGAIEPRSIPEELGPVDAGAMREQIAEGDLARDVRVGDLKPGQILRDRIIPAHLPFVDHHGDAGGGERLRTRADGEDGLIVDG